MMNPNGGWDVKHGGRQRSSTHADTKSAEEKSGREIKEYIIMTLMLRS